MGAWKFDFPQKIILSLPTDQPTETGRLGHRDVHFEQLKRPCDMDPYLRCVTDLFEGGRIRE